MGLLGAFDFEDDFFWTAFLGTAFLGTDFLARVLSLAARSTPLRVEEETDLRPVGFDLVARDPVDLDPADLDLAAVFTPPLDDFRLGLPRLFVGFSLSLAAGADLLDREPLRAFDDVALADDPAGFPVVDFPRPREDFKEALLSDADFLFDFFAVPARFPDAF